MRLSIVIPAHNEEERLEPTLAAYWGEFQRDAEIIVVVNGSHDRTAEIARAFARGHRGVEVLEIAGAIGKGAAVKSGFRVSKGDWVGFVDADLATSPTEFRRILEAANGADGALASRWARGARIIGRSAFRALASRVFAGLVRLLFGLPFSDTQCGAKVFRHRYVAGILSASQVNDMAFDVELLVYLQRAGARMIEVPTVWVSQPGSTALGNPLRFVRHGLRMVRSLLQLRRRLPVPAPVPQP